MSPFMKNFLNEWPFRLVGVKVDMSDVTDADKADYLKKAALAFAGLAVVGFLTFWPLGVVFALVAARKAQMAFSKGS